MNKKILIISASPRKNGNSDILCNQFMLGSQEAGHYVEKIFIKDKKINYCTGCGSCYGDGNSCSQKDDMNEILKKMIEADTIVMATPVYFYTMNGQMKTLIDRTCSNYTEIKSKEFYFIMTAADPDKESMSRTIDGFRGFTSCLENPVEKGIIYGIDAWNIGDIKDKPAMKEAYEMGRTV